VEYTNNLMYAKHINKSTRMHQLDHCFILLNKKMTTSVLSSWMYYQIKTNFNLQENVLNLMNRRSMNSYLFSKDTSFNIINVGERKKDDRRLKILWRILSTTCSVSRSFFYGINQSYSL